MSTMTKGGKIAACIALGILIVLGVGFVTMTLWNWLVPKLFNGPVIDFWQAIGLLLLSKLLFWGFGGKRHHHPGSVHWKQGLSQKFSNMSPEEREAFKQKLKDKWCRWEDEKKSSEAPRSND